MWDSFKGVKINSGFGTEGSVNLRFWAVDSKILLNDELFGAYKTVEKGKDDSEFLERHFRNLSWRWSETTNGVRRRNRSIERMEDLEDTIFLIFLLFQDCCSQSYLIVELWNLTRKLSYLVLDAFVHSELDFRIMNLNDQYCQQSQIFSTRRI